MTYLFQNATAFDPYTATGVPNAVGQVFALSDPDFLTPLPVTLLSSGLQTTELVSDQYSQLPGFDAGDRVQVVFKSGEFTKILNTSTPLPGPMGPSAYGVAAENGYTGTEAEYNATLADAGNLVSRAETAEQAAVDAANLVESPADSAVEVLVDGPATLTRLKLDALYVDRRGTRGVTRTIYVRADGSDTNDGSSSLSAFREIRAAVDSLAADMPVLRGSVVIDVGAGNYKGGIRMPLARGNAQDDYLTIRGPAVGAHPNVPTAIIDYALDTSPTWGFLAEDGDTIWLENLKFVGAFPTAVRVERGVFLQWRNVHVDGQGVGVTGVSIQHQCRYVILGGIVENLTTTGVLELFGCTRSFGTATSNATQMIIRNVDGIGFQAKEAGVGHLDYLNVEDCGTGIQLNGGCVSNVKMVSLKRNTVGLANVNSEIHNSQSVQYGSGADANGRGYIAIGANATDLSDIGWTGDTYAYTTTAGVPALTMLASSYADSTITGVTAETDFYNLSAVLPMQRYNVAGRRVKIVVWGSVNVAPTTSTGYRLILRFGTVLIGEARVPQSAVVGDDFKAEFDVVCSADGNTQKVMSSMHGYAPVPTNYAPRTFDFTSQAGPVSVKVSGIAGATSESVTLRMIEVWG